MKIKIELKYIRPVVFILVIVGVLAESLKGMQSQQEYMYAKTQKVTMSELRNMFYKTEINKKISIEFNNETIEQALRKVARKTGLKLSYRGDIISDKRVSLSRKKISVSNILEYILEETKLDYMFSRDGHLLIVTRQESDLQTAEMQETVTGTVTSADDGNPLPGVNVLIKGTNSGATTNADGKYQLSVPSLNDTLLFSFIGFVTKEIPIDNRSVIDVALATNVEALNEVVVTALGIRREVRSLTYANQEVHGDQIDEAKEVNIVNSLQGKVAGVTITKNATGPGGEAKVLIRGNRSITNSNQPLYVVDGVPLNGSVEMLNSDDVASISVLKGASAAALYGSQGQNGAIIITTKSGESGKIQVNYNGGFTLDQATVLPELQYQYGQGDVGVYDPNSENSWGPKADGQMVNLWNGDQVPLEGQPNRLNNFFRTAQTFNNTLSIQGGNEKMQTYFSYGNTQAQGILRNNDLTRHNVNLKFDNTISSKLSFSTKLNYIFEDVDNRVVPGGSGNYVLPSIYLTPTSIPIDEMKQYSYIDDTGAERQNYWNVGSSVMMNPYWAMNRVLYYQKKDRVLGLLTVKYDFSEWLNFQIRGSLDKTIQNNDRKTYADNYWSQVGSNYQYDKNISQGINVDALLSFNRSMSRKFDLSGNVGASLQESRYESESGNANGLFKPNYFFMNNAKDAFVSTSYGRSPQVQSLYGTATLGYNKYLYLDVTARNDWSSALPKGNQSYFYPSIGLSAIVSDMFELPSWVSYGKIRVTLANSGYGGTEYLDRNYYSVGSGGAIITPSIQSLGNYKPEITTSLETGLDWRFFNNRFGFNLTYYNTKTKNQLLLIGTPPASLFDQKYINAGLIQNSGIEVVSNFTPVVGREFSWDATVNFSKNINKVKRLTDNMKSVVINEGDNVYLIEVDEGSSYGDMYVRGWKKDAQGRHLVQEDGTPILTQGLDQFVGNVNPDYMLGFSSSFSYKNFSLSFLIDHRQGGVVISGTQALIDGYGDSKASLRGRENGIILDGYTEDGTENTSTISSQKYFSLIGGRYPSAEFYSYSGTNTRLRELIFSYRFSNKTLSKIGVIKTAQISLVGRNLFFFQRSAPIDPEVTRGVNGAGLEYAALPSTRNFGVNFKLSF